MNKQIEMVEQFHNVFGVVVNENPCIPPFDIQELRKKLIFEEAKEVCEAYNLEEIAKELCDLLYVTYGTILSYGLSSVIEKCFEEVHRSNMSKLAPCPDAVDENGLCNATHCEIFHKKPIYREDGKVLKSKLYTPANLKPIIKT